MKVLDCCCINCLALGSQGLGTCSNMQRTILFFKLWGHNVDCRMHVYGAIAVAQWLNHLCRKWATIWSHLTWSACFKKGWMLINMLVTCHCSRTIARSFVSYVDNHMFIPLARPACFEKGWTLTNMFSTRKASGTNLCIKGCAVIFLFENVQKAYQAICKEVAIVCHM